MVFTSSEVLEISPGWTVLEAVHGWASSGFAKGAFQEHPLLHAEIETIPAKI
jgi:hypothetical protein